MEKRPESAHRNSDQPDLAISERSGKPNNFALQPVGNRSIEVIADRCVDCHAVQSRNTALGQSDESPSDKVPSAISSPWQKNEQTPAMLTRFR